ncbi:MAG: hypothetical protein Q8Q32_00210 [bacterium]|nr:hypothetical protein [bacterium]
MKKYLLDFGIGILLAYVVSWTGVFGYFEMNLGNLYIHAFAGIVSVAVIFTLWNFRRTHKSYMHIIVGTTPVFLTEVFGILIGSSLF